MKPGRFVRLALASVLACSGAAAAPFAVPVRKAAAPEAFVPQGWTVELSIDGELDGNAVADRVLVLLENEHEGGDRNRAFVVLLKRAEGWELAGTNGSFLPCFSCMGAKGGDGAPEIEIRNRVIGVTVWGGSRYWYGVTHRLRWNAGVHKVQLIGLDEDEGDSATGKTEESSYNFLTGDVITVTTPPQQDNEGKATNAVPRTKRGRFPKRPLLELERVKWPE